MSTFMDIRTPLIDDDPGAGGLGRNYLGGPALSHVYWDQLGFHDSRGNTWTLNGSVTFAAQDSASALPWRGTAGASTFGPSNNYQLGTGAGILNFSAAPFLVVVVGITSSVSNAQMLFANSNAGVTTGFDLQLASGSGAGLATNRGTGNSSTTNVITPGVPWVISAGTSGTSLMVKLNMGAVVTSTNAFAANAANGAFIGSSAASSGAVATQFIEFYAAAQTPTPTLLTNINRLVLRGLGLDQPDYNLA